MRSINGVVERADSAWQDYDFSGPDSALLGQRMTPGAVATLMAAMPSIRRKTVSILDPGAGLGVLTAAYVDRLLKNRSSLVQAITATAVEVDSRLVSGLRRTLDDCKIECGKLGIAFNYRIVTDEFVSSSMRLVPQGELQGQHYDCILMNPPYAKLHTTTTTYRLLLDAGVRVTNWYAAFVVGALNLLTDGGELVAITPRSFCNGTYFRPFRRVLLTSTALQRVHIFDSRSAAFRRDDVLQETIIFHVRRSPRPKVVEIATSPAPAARLKLARVPYTRVIRPDDPEMFVRLPGDRDDHDLLPSGRHDLGALGLRVSTGPIVDFRVREHLRFELTRDDVPLIYPMHFSGGLVIWPRPLSKKHNAIANVEQTRRQLVANDRYVLVRRFSTKEEPRRVVAVVYEPVGGTRRVGLENHLNYFHLNGHGLDRDLAWGLALFLNSTAVDRHLRTFSGHTQVNAGDLKALQYPSLDMLRALGSRISQMPNQAEIDRAVSTLATAA